jgi:hypothetical protein
MAPPTKAEKRPIQRAPQCWRAPTPIDARQHRAAILVRKIDRVEARNIGVHRDRIDLGETWRDVLRASQRRAIRSARGSVGMTNDLNEPKMVSRSARTVAGSAVVS